MKSVQRKIKRITRGRNAVDGAGVKLVRVVGYNDSADYDPFLMLDAFDSSNPSDYIKGFPWHPHRGIETITYLMEGVIEHMDSLGNKGVIRPGDCQWMSAGSGIIHQEMPQPSKRLLGAQLWLNMPKVAKLSDPSYADIRSENIPVVSIPTGEVKIIAGSYEGTSGAFQGKYVQATYLDVWMKEKGTWRLETPYEDNVFLYLVDGSASVADSEPISMKTALLCTHGEEIVVSTTTGVRFLLLSAKPLEEPIAWGGPIVMNTKEELQKAFQELDEGTFIKHKR